MFSSCQGELVQKELYVKGIDQNGKVLVDQNIITLKNGFFELWLPRDRKVTLTIRSAGLTATGIIETFANSKTCVTTFQLR